MTELRIRVAPGRVDEAPADLAVVGIFEDERPLRDASGQADWRLCGALSRVIRAGRLAGTPGEAALLPGGGGFRAEQVLVLGLGPRGEFEPARADERLRDAIDRTLALRARSFALALPAARESADAVAPLEERAARWLAVLVDALSAADPADPTAVLDAIWVVRPEERPRARPALRRALSQPLASHVRVHLAEPDRAETVARRDASHVARQPDGAPPSGMRVK